MRAISFRAILLCSVSLTPFAAPPGPKSTRARPSDELTAERIEQAADVRAVAPGSAGPAVVRAQILLDRARFSPGEIDGKYGADLAIAIKSYQQHHHLKPTGVIDPQTWKLLNQDRGPLTTTYTITAADVKEP